VQTACDEHVAYDTAFHPAMQIVACSSENLQSNELPFHDRHIYPSGTTTGLSQGLSDSPTIASSFPPSIPVRCNYPPNPRSPPTGLLTTRGEPHATRPRRQPQTLPDSGREGRILRPIILHPELADLNHSGQLFRSLLLVRFTSFTFG
jgi:hypothetical protein